MRLSSAECEERLRAARVVLWNWYAFMEACRTWPERLPASHYCEEIEGQPMVVFKPPYLDRYHFFVVQGWIDGGVVAHSQTFDLWEAAHAGPLYYMFELFMQSRYTHIQAMKPTSPSADRRENKGRSSEVISVIARRPEKVHSQEERKLREEAEREGKSWILGHESHTEGHWRMQWYPSIKKHKAIFIEDFVRGAGKPQREGVRVTKVVR